MAFKRSAVRSRLSPPNHTNPNFLGSDFVLLSPPKGVIKGLFSYENKPFPIFTMKSTYQYHSSALQEAFQVNASFLLEKIEMRPYHAGNRFRLFWGGRSGAVQLFPYPPATYLPRHSSSRFPKMPSYCMGCPLTAWIYLPDMAGSTNKAGSIFITPLRKSVRR